MYKIETMQSCIQDWFADASDTKEVAKTYHEVLAEAEKQMEFMMNELSKGYDPN